MKEDLDRRPGLKHAILCAIHSSVQEPWLDPDRRHMADQATYPHLGYADPDP
jgi:hypothetical protein